MKYVISLVKEIVKKRKMIQMCIRDRRRPDLRTAPGDGVSDLGQILWNDIA